MTSIAEAQRKAAIKRAKEAREKAEKDLRSFVGKRLPPDAKKGSILPLKFYPDEALTTPCEPVDDFGPELSDLISSMAMTMYMTGGVGLAANQVGVLKRVFVCDVRSNLKDKRDDFRVFVNPVILTATEDMEMMREGCLSFPGARENIERPKRVLIRAFTPSGQPFEAELGGWEARVALHEFDHLEGITWLDYMKPMQKRMVLRRMSKVKRQIVLDERAAKKRAKQQRRRR